MIYFTGENEFAESGNNDYAHLLRRGVEFTQGAVMREKRNFVERLIWKLKHFFKPEPEIPEDPYAYVSAPKKPRLPGRSAAAVAELPEE
jgi:hypothetical protein